MGSNSEREAPAGTELLGHGHTSELTIETSDHSLVLETDDLVVATYIETHHLADRRNDRRTTVVFAKNAEGPHGVRWLHVHETFLPVH